MMSEEKDPPKREFGFMLNGKRNSLKNDSNMKLKTLSIRTTSLKNSFKSITNSLNSPNRNSALNEAVNIVNND